MSGSSSSNHFDSDIREVASVICREFRVRFKVDPQVRIEAFLDTLEGWVGQFEQEASHSARTALIAELISTEMELLLANSQKIDVGQYEQRFPGYASAIHSAVKRIQVSGSKSLVVDDSKTLTTGLDSRRTHISLDADATEGQDDLILDLKAQLDLGRDDTLPLQFGPYQQIERINSGGFGTVCRAIDSRDQQVVALKFPRRDKLRNHVGLKVYIEEANKAMTLDHPGIVRTLGIEAHDGNLAIVQQFIDGGDLKSPLVQPSGQAEIVNLIANLADPLAYAHRQGIYHRDLKPGNILLDRQGKPYLADFGLALHELDQLNAPSQRCGTTYYMPPEQVAGLTRRLDGRSDIWSLGVVFYELLTHRRPFDGVTERDIFDQIENKDPRPPRQIDASIDREIQRICLKCLERQQRDRYPTADELAEDLRHWLEYSKVQTNYQPMRQPAQPSAGQTQSMLKPSTLAEHSGSVRPEAAQTKVSSNGSVDSPQPGQAASMLPSAAIFHPRGIRAYSSEDAEFFLDLLPGPRNRDGIPDSIRFWLSRICEPVRSTERVPLGVLFGPSGSGKTSFVRAGLLPLLPVGVATIYVEASQTKTADQLQFELRSRLPAIAADIPLPDLFRGLAQGKWLPVGIHKLLIVVDQFEQYLSLDGDLQTAQLVKALRHCDGKNLQCLLLFRDDFLTRLARFLDALELDFREGKNAQAIDLFDRKHAQRVLAKLGRACGQLPPEPEELSAAQLRFLEQAVNQLAQGDHLICVHLTLFAEMFRHLAWTPEELKKVGGVAGTGEKYLELTFGPHARDKRLYHQREAIQAILELLLPPEGSDIRGTIRSERELIAAAGMAQQPQLFADLISALDGQLRLITRIDPELVRPLLPDQENPSQTANHYQLTHDYLVPSIRAWLENGWGLTRAGRAKTHLRKLAKLVVPGKKPPKLPTSLEWLNWQFILPRKSLSVAEQSVLRAAGARFAKQLAAMVALCSFVGWLAIQEFRSRQLRQQTETANDLITTLLHEEVRKVPQFVQELGQLEQVAVPILTSRFQKADFNSREQIRLAMALLPHDASHLSLLVQSLTDAETSPEQIQTIVELLSQTGLQEKAATQSSYEDVTLDPQIRFRALVSEVALRQGRGAWRQYDGLVISGLQQEPASSLDGWLKLLKPAGPQFTEKFNQIWSATVDGNQASVLAKALLAFLSEPDRQTFFLSAIQAANEGQFSGLMQALEESGKAPQMIPSLNLAVAQAPSEAAQANLSAALFRLGVDQPLIEMYRGGLEDQKSLIAVFASKPERLPAHELMSLYEKLGLAEFDDPLLRRSVLQALAHHAGALVDQALQNRLTSIAYHHVENDPDPCCFSTAELLLIRLGVGSRPAWRKLRRAKTADGILGKVLIDRHNNAYSIQETEFGTLAISTTELTCGTLSDYCQAAGIDRKLPASELPFEIAHLRDLKLVLDYCNWLSLENQIAEDQLCYPLTMELDQVPLVTPKIAKAGYRLPSLEEFRWFNASSAPMLKLKMDSKSLALDYAWAFQNSIAVVQPVGRRLPNSIGVFDAFGNVQELSQSQHNVDTEWHSVGQTVRAEVSAFAVESAAIQPVAANIWTRVGFRITRRLN